MGKRRYRLGEMVPGVRYRVVDGVGPACFGSSVRLEGGSLVLGTGEVLPLRGSPSLDRMVVVLDRDHYQKRLDNIQTELRRIMAVLEEDNATDADISGLSIHN